MYIYIYADYIYIYIHTDLYIHKRKYTPIQINSYTHIYIIMHPLPYALLNDSIITHCIYSEF